MALLGVATLLPRALLAIGLGVWGSPERWEYDVIAASLVDGTGLVYDRDGFTYHAYAPPLWSLVLAALLLLPGDSRLSIQITQALLCLGAATIVAVLARRICRDARTGMIAGLMVALQPSLLYYSVVKSDPLPLNAFLLGGLALAGSHLIQTPDRRSSIAFGLLVGLGTLSRGTPAVALPLIVAFLLGRWRRQAWPFIAGASIAFAMCLTPWLGRNLALIGAPLITSTTGENFWRGNHRGASGGVVDLDGGDITTMIPVNESLPKTIRTVLAGGTELERHRVFMAEAWQFISADPGSAAVLFARKLRTFWWRIDSDPRDYPPVAALGYQWIFRAELLFALLGAFFMLKAPLSCEAAAWCLALIIALSLLQCAFYVQGRHRFLIEPVLLMFTAAGVVRLTRRL